MVCKRLVFHKFEITCFDGDGKQSKDGTICLVCERILSSIFLKRNAFGAFIVSRPNIRQIWLIFFNGVAQT